MCALFMFPELSRSVCCLFGHFAPLSAGACVGVWPGLAAIITYDCHNYHLDFISWTRGPISACRDASLFCCSNWKGK